MNILVLTIYNKKRKSKRTKNQIKKMRIKNYKISRLFKDCHISGCDRTSESLENNLTHNISIGYGAFQNIANLKNE